MIDKSPESLNIITAKTACNRDCPDACGLIATVDDGRITRLQGDPDHPVTQGFLCHRTSRFLERQYDDKRITSPLKRVGDQWQTIDWATALDEIANKMLQIRAESTAAAIMHYRCGGSMGLMKHVTDYFFERFGPVTIKSGDICTGAGDAAQTADFGDLDSNDMFDLRHSRNIILWGKNVFVSQVHLIPLLKEVRKAGAKLILIDPVRHRTADICDHFVQVRPGGDRALALGVARCLFDRNDHDPQAADYCDHFESFRETANRRPLEEWAEMADVQPEDIEDIATALADRPTATLIGWGMQRRKYGSTTVRTIDALVTASGNLGITGGGVSFYFKRRGAFDTSFCQGAAVAPRTIPEPMIGPGILAADDPPIRMVWVTAANPVAMLPESDTIAKALGSRELTVVVDSFMTDTARLAHYILPTTTMLEDDDLLGAYGHHWIVEAKPVIPPPDDVRTDYQISQELARRVELGDEFSMTVRQWKERLLSPVSGNGVNLDALSKGACRNPLSPEVIFSERRFATETGRVQMVQAVSDELPEVTADRPLLLMALSSQDVQGSQWLAGRNEELLPATVHPSVAAGFSDGDAAKLESDHGNMIVQLKFDDEQRTDVVIVPKGGWLGKGRCANALVKAELTDDGGCGVLYDTPVSISCP